MAQAQIEMRTRIRRWTILLGVLQITVGCLVGLIPPPAVAWFRGLVMSHIEFTANGVLMLAFGFLVTEMRLPPLPLKLWFVLLQVGTWTNGAAGLAGALLGQSSYLLPTLNDKFPAPSGANHPLVTGLLQVCAITMLGALGLTLYGLLRAPDRTVAADD